MTGLGLYAQAKEFLAASGLALGPRFAVDTRALPAFRADDWAVWASRARIGSGGSHVGPEVMRDPPPRTEVSLVKPGPVRLVSTTPRA